MGCAVWEQGKILENDAQVPAQRVNVLRRDGLQVVSTHSTGALGEV